MNILLTGFEPFSELDSNPTEHIVKTINEEAVAGKTIFGKVLPVDFQLAGAMLTDYMKEYNPDAVVLLGLAAGRNRITPERIAINCMDGDQDNEGNQYTDKKIIAGGPDAYFSTLPIRKITQSLQHHSIPSSISNTAGTYVCNQVMYQAAHFIKLHKLEIPSGFIHMPAHHDLAVSRPSLPSWSLDDLLKATRIILEEI
ncbi:pyroglutamyl-peptidase I [Halobacillus campisalis]|uniref:Pyroglutamyl-peptidase I n=1 Tax=Halobacillus campisalis TaxID=435909 RepID=A0ABW2K6B7_9BACI|nr:pyroglutamyl-peptidase I [Halobacillus campisalis]